MTGGRIFFYVQHLLGVGHLQRAARLCRGLTAGGLEVDVISGGVPVPWLELGEAKLFQLPALKVGPDGWYDLRDEGDRPVDDDWKQDRCDRLLGLFAERRPDVLLIEAFP
ncbi:MAG: glycosyl transferase, partial [Alphaproteobacteria bacterium]|nr:glycosyl transferase [Alphaproteobacteria bacterium]